MSWLLMIYDLIFFPFGIPRLIIQFMFSLWNGLNISLDDCYDDGWLDNDSSCDISKKRKHKKKKKKKKHSSGKKCKKDKNLGVSMLECMFESIVKELKCNHTFRRKLIEMEKKKIKMGKNHEKDIKKNRIKHMLKSKRYAEDCIVKRIKDSCK